MNIDNDQKILLENILSLLQEIMQSSGVEEETPINEEVVMESAVVEDDEVNKNVEEDDKDKDVEKELVNTPSDGSTANDDAEERVDEPLPEASEENVKDVSKMLNLLKRMNVKKSNNDSKVLKEILQVTKNLAGRQNDTEEALTHVLKGLGVAKEIEKINDIEKSEKVTKGLNNTQDVNNTVDILAQAISKVNKQSNTGESINEVRKTLRNVDLLQGLVKRK